MPAPVPLPPARTLALPGRGHVEVRDFGPPAGPALVLLHGWTATADLNWYTSYAALGRQFRVVAFDLRGHGRGVRSRAFRLSDCADDAAAVADALGIEAFTAVGYSMGGAVAQLTWSRHPDRVEGLVLCATARRFAGASPGERMVFGGMLGLSLAARLTPPALRSQAVDAVIRRRGRPGLPGDIADWAMDEVRLNDPAAVLQAGSALGRFDSRPWISRVTAPTAVVVSTQDHLVAPRSQLALARSIPGAEIFPVAGDHGMCVADAPTFVPALVAACESVTERALTRRAG